jgi:hypothetical protein
MKFWKTMKNGAKYTLVGLLIGAIAWLLEILYIAIVALTSNITVTVIGFIILLILLLFVSGYVATKVFKLK